MSVGHKQMRRAWKRAEEFWKDRAKRQAEEQRAFDVAKARKDREAPEERSAERVREDSTWTRRRSR